MNSRSERLRGTLVLAALTDAHGRARTGHAHRARPGAPVGVLGGLSGAFSVITALVALPRASAMVVIAAALLGQSMASLAIIHLGWLDVPRIPVNAWRLIGMILPFAGVLRIQSERWLPCKGRSAYARPSSEDPES